MPTTPTPTATRRSTNKELSSQKQGKPPFPARPERAIIHKPAKEPLVQDKDPKGNPIELIPEGRKLNADIQRERKN
jgi:hypothetical protein